jgi:hypothetical protein
MARTLSALGSVEMAAEGIRCKLCPVTCGRPTRMLKATFKKLCDHHRNEQRESAVANYNWKKEQKTSWCGECKGTLPPELELINKGELIDMAEQKLRGTCESCKKKNVTIGNNYGLKMCSSCAAVFSAVNNRFPVVAEAIKRTGRADEAKKLLGSSLVEFAPVTVESTALEEIAAAVGYKGTDGDVLIEEVRRLAQAAVSGVSGKKSVSADVVRALGCTEAEWEMAAIQSEAYSVEFKRRWAENRIELAHVADAVSYPGKESGPLHEFIGRLSDEFVGLLGDLAKIKEATGFVVEDSPQSVVESVALLAQTLDQYRTRCEELSAKTREHEQLASYRDQILLAVKDALGRPLISVNETPYQVECLVQELEQLRGGSDRPSVIPMSSADTVLLDLALDALRGNITGLDPDRIAMLREAV